MTEVEQHIKGWIEKVSDIRPELQGFSVCPFAKNAKYVVIETLAEDIMPISGYDVVFYVIEDYFDIESVQYWVNFYNNVYDDWLFFEDCPYPNTYVGSIQSNNGRYNLILMQNKQHLRKHREKLVKTGYYHHWNDLYLKKILGDDYKMLKNSG